MTPHAHYVVSMPLDFPPTHAWGIETPFAKNPYVLVYSIRRTRKEAIDCFATTLSLPWKFAYRMGYRAVSVIIRRDKE